MEVVYKNYFVYNEHVSYFILKWGKCKSTLTLQIHTTILNIYNNNRVILKVSSCRTDYLPDVHHRAEETLHFNVTI